jgi:predicted DNA-binding protein
MPNHVRIVIQLPINLKTRLDNLKQQGYTASGFIRAVLEREFAKMEEKPVTPLSVVKRVNSR